MDRLYSFVLPAFKARFFKEAIDSILAQTYTNFELIIVNDASPEDLDSIVNSYNDIRIQYYVNNTNIGGKDLVAQWNYCIQFAIGDYVILASDDDVYFPDYLNEMDSLIEKYPNVNVFRPRVQKIDAMGNITRIENVLKEYSSLCEFLYFKHCNSIFSGIPYYLIKREALSEISGFINFPLAWYSDDATIAILAQRGVTSSQKILFSFRLSGESISTKKNNSTLLRGKLEASVKFYDWLVDLLSTLPQDNKYNEFYRNKVVKESYMKRNLDCVDLLQSSTIFAIFSNVLLVLRKKIVPVKYLLKIFLFKIIS